jgi:hypothetical protein
MKSKDLLQQIKDICPQKYTVIKALIEDSFFMYKHLLLTNCLFDNEVCGFSIYYPHITPNTRTVFILFIEIVK